MLVAGQEKSEGIIADDDTPFVSISAFDAINREADTGQTAFTFKVSLDKAISRAVTVNWAVDPASDADAADFGGSFPSDSVTIPAGLKSETFNVPVSGDVDVEPSELFYVNISNPTNARLVTPGG